MWSPYLINNLDFPDIRDISTLKETGYYLTEKSKNTNIHLQLEVNPD